LLKHFISFRNFHFILAFCIQHPKNNMLSLFVSDRNVLVCNSFCCGCCCCYSFDCAFSFVLYGNMHLMEIILIIALNNS